MALVGFEDITVALTPEEIRIANIIARRFNNRPKGRKNAATNVGIRKVIKDYVGETLSGPKMRRIIQYIRSENLVPRLCATSNGYFVAENDKEWNDWKTSMKQRIRQMEYTLACSEFFGDGGNEKL